MMGHSDTAATAPASGAAARRGWAVVVYLLFFLSGMTSLIYEVVWVRKFGLVFGITTYAVSTVLAAFFAGLAIGSYVAGRIIDRTRAHPLLVYGILEGAIGVYALLLPTLLRLVEATYPAVYSQISESFSLFTLFRFVVSFVLLAIPTTLMGATLPVLSKLMVDREEVLGLNVGRLYAVNTFGAVAGTFCAGFVLLPALGIPSTTLAAAMGNFFLAAAAVLLSASPGLAPSRRRDRPLEPATPPAPLRRSERIILALAFSSGLAILALEVVWTRSLVLVLGASTYAFSTMLTAVLVGIAVGSAVFAPLADRVGNRGAVAAALLFLGGFCAALGPAIINRLPFAFLQLYDWTSGVWSLVVLTQFVVSFLLVFIPTFLSGASFPILVRMYSLGIDRVGRTVADVYAVNTLGGILGSLVGGFVLVKYFGLQPSLTIAALFLMLVGGTLAVGLAKPWPRSLRAGTAAAAAALVLLLAFVHPRFSTKLLFAGWGPFAGGYYVSWMGGSTVDVTDRHMQRLLYHKEGVTTSVDVLQTGWDDKIISINAKPVATTYLYDMRLLRMAGHLPVLLHPDPIEAVVIGMGAGVSSGCIAIYPTVEHLTIVEISPEVPGGTEKFAEWNYDVLNNPKVDVVFNDGANYMKATRKQFDVISSDPFHPFVSGAATLYSREHWEACKEHLREGGIIAQYLPLYHLSARDFAMIVGTFVDAFPNASMWFCGVDTVLIGSKGPLRVDLDRMGDHMSDPTVASALLDMGVHAPGDVLGWYVAGPEELQEMAIAAPRNHTDFPILEFSAPKAITLTGVASTMPAVLTAFERVSPYEIRQRLNEMCVQRLNAQTLYDAANTRQAGRWLMRGQLLYSYDFPGEYLDAVNQALALRPHDRFVRRTVADAQYMVGEQQMADGYPGEAYEYYSDSYENDPTSAMALAAAVDAALSFGDVALSEQALEQAAAEHESAFEILVYKGIVAMRRSKYEDARRAFEEAAALGQESPTMHVGIGLLELREGNQEASRERFGQALEISTYPLDTLYDIVDSCTSAGLTFEARPYAQQLASLATAAIAADPGDPSLYDYRSLAFSTMGEQSLASRDQTTSRSLKGWWQEAPTTGSDALSGL
jgi:spermidine synthase